MQVTTLYSEPMMANVDDNSSVLSYCHYLVMKAQLTGNLCFDGHKPTKEENLIAERCRVFSGKLARSLEGCRINEIPDLLDYYDLTYRIGNKCLPDKRFINKQKQRVIKVWKAGDRTIAESAVFGMVAPEVAYHREKADREYYTVYRIIKGRWLTTLKKYGYFPDATSYENYQRLALIMRENLSQELGASAEPYRRRWYERNKIRDLARTSSLILRSYRRFATSLFPKVLDYGTQMQVDNSILSELSNRTDLSPYDRAAFRLALDHNRQFTSTH